MSNYLTLRPLFSTLISLPELRVISTMTNVNDILRDFVLEFKRLSKTGINGGAIDVYGAGLQICSIDYSFIYHIFTHNFVKTRFWNHEGIRFDNRLILPLWGYIPNTTIQGSWEVYLNNGLVAKVTQNPSPTDPISIALICSYPEKWLKKLDISNDLSTSLTEVTAYIEIYSINDLEIESVLSCLAAVGLHAYNTHDNWTHCIRCGCQSIESASGIIEISNNQFFNIDRSRMFRFACSAIDPFDALLRYWYVAEHMYDDLIYTNVNNLLQSATRPPRFGRAISKFTVEVTCSKEVFLKNMSNSSINQLIHAVNSSSLLSSANTAISLILDKVSDASFWTKTTPDSQKEALGAFLYSCRNAVAHRRESEKWFDRLDTSHTNYVQEIIPIVHEAIYFLLQDM